MPQRLWLKGGIMKTIKEMISSLFITSVRNNNIELDMTEEQLRRHRMCTSIQYIGQYISVVFSFFLRLATTEVEQGKIILGLILFSIYYFNNTIVRSIEGLFNAIEEQDRNDLDEELSDNCANTLEKTRGQVKSRDEKHGYWYILNNSEILSTVKNVLATDWGIEINFPLKVFSVFVTIATAIVAIVTEKTIDSRIMVSLILCTLILGFFIKFEHTKRIRNTYKVWRESGKKRDSYRADLINSASLCREDFDYRINEYRAVIKEERKAGLLNIRSNTIANILSSFLQCSFQLIYIWMFVSSVGIENVTVGDIAVMTGGITIIASINRQLDRIIDALFHKINVINSLEPYMNDFESIITVLRNNSSVEKKNVDEIVFPSIEIGYEEDSENDMPFKLISDKPIRLRRGDVAILKGASGSGKSTLVKVLTGQLIQDNVEGLVTADYYMYYCKDHSLGNTNSLFDELFIKGEADLEKMKDILLNLHLWQEFSYNCKDVWQWLKEKKFVTLSDGQKQRIVCAKLLYLLNDKIDLVAFDEATSGLDADDTYGEGDAQEVLEYIIRFCNKDRKRIVIIATHQNTDKLVSKIHSEYNVRNFVFRKNGTKNVVFES